MLYSTLPATTCSAAPETALADINWRAHGEVAVPAVPGAAGVADEEMGCGEEAEDGDDGVGVGACVGDVADEVAGPGEGEGEEPPLLPNWALVWKLPGFAEVMADLHPHIFRTRQLSRHL